MPRTPDRRPGELEDEGILLEDTGADPTTTGGIRYNAGSFKMRDGTGVFNPRTGGASGIIITRAITVDLTIVTGTTHLQREPVVSDGVTVTAQDGGELLVL